MKNLITIAMVLFTVGAYCQKDTQDVTIEGAKTVTVPQDTTIKAAPIGAFERYEIVRLQETIKQANARLVEIVNVLAKGAGVEYLFTPTLDQQVLNITFLPREQPK